MDFSLLDSNVSLTTNIFVIIANVINLIYNIPQMYKTWQTKSTKDFSTAFLVMRIAGNTIWIAYAIEISSFLMLLNNCVTVFASIFIFYFKAIELNEERKLKHKEIINKDKDNDKEILIVDDKV
jgi:MtN3 and saliva related transmembrane protein